MDVNKAVLKAKEANKKLVGIGGTKDKTYSPHDLYLPSKELAEHLSYHATKGIFPEKLFHHRSPTQTQQEYDYIKNNYKQYTLPVFVDFVNTVGRIFADNNWSIEYPKEKEGDDFKTYTETKIPVFGSVENYVKFVLLPNKLIDANGFVAVRPKELPTKEEEGVLVIDGSKKYEPIPYFYPSKNVIDYELDEYYLFLSAEKSNVTVGQRTENTGSVYEFYSKEGMFFIVQKGRKSDNDFDIKEWISYESIPVVQMKGIPQLVGEDILWQSQFTFAVDLLDSVVINKNWLDASIAKCVFPIPVMYGTPCEFQEEGGGNCIDGIISFGGVQKTCSKCHGSGLRNRLGPLNTILLRPPSKHGDGDAGLTQDPLKFVSPDTKTLEFISDKADNDEDKARKILHLQTSNTQVKGTDNLTATGMVIDTKTMYAFIKPISDQIFSIFEFILNKIGEQRDENFEPVVIHYPKTFDFKTPEDYLTEISSAIKNNMPPSFIQYVLMKYIDSIYGDSPKTVKIFSIITEADRLFGLSQEQIDMKLAKGTAGKWEDILHNSAVNFITTSIQADPKFLDKDLQSQVKILQDMAKKKEAELGASTANSIYDSTLGGG